MEKTPPGSGAWRRIFRWPALAGLALAAVTSVPYAAGWRAPLPDSRFNGALEFHHDFNTYFAFQRQAQSGDWLFHNPFTPEYHEKVFFNLEWLAAGKLARLTGWGPEAVLQIQRVLGAVLLGGALYRLLSFLFETEAMRRLVWMWVMLGGGFGWVLYLRLEDTDLARSMFLDLYAALHPFFWVMLQPHNLVAQGLAVTGLWLLLRAEQTGRSRDFLAAGCCYAAVAAVRIHDAVWLGLATALYIAARGRAGALRRMMVLLPAAPFLIYYTWLFRVHPVFRVWTEQSNLPPAPPSHLALSLGLGFVLFVLGLGNLGDLRRKAPARALVGCCLLAGLGLFYCYPAIRLSLQFLPALSIPMALVGTMSLEPAVVGAIRRSRWSWLAIAGVLAAHSATSWVLLSSYTEAAREGQSRTDRRLLEAYGWLNDHSRPRDIVLAPPAHGNRIPRYTHNTVFCGNAFSTVEVVEKHRLIAKFLDRGTQDEFRRQLIHRYQIRFVLLEPPGLQAAWLREVFRNRAAVIYRPE